MIRLSNHRQKRRMSKHDRREFKSGLIQIRLRIEVRRHIARLRQKIGEASKRKPWVGVGQKKACEASEPLMLASA